MRCDRRACAGDRRALKDCAETLSDRADLGSSWSYRRGRPRGSAAPHRSISRLSDAEPTEQLAPTLRPQSVAPTA
jgi:hypothetical protein